MLKTILILITFTILLNFCYGDISIEQYGAKSDIETVEQAKLNSKAIQLALEAAHSGSDKTVYVPKKTYWIMSMNAVGLVGVSLSIQGTLRVMKVENSLEHWGHNRQGTYNHIFLLENCTDFELVGSGMNGPVNIDGNGRGWWLFTILNLLSYERPRMFRMTHAKNVSIHDIHVIDAPFYHFDLRDVLDVMIHDVRIYVDLEEQARIQDRNGYRHPISFLREMKAKNIPIDQFWTHLKVAKPSPLDFIALNTDGFDLAGKNIKVWNIDVTNFDDVVAVKPLSNEPGQYSICSQDMTITNSTITYGVGLTIGSVPPNVNHACVRNIVFKTATFDSPYKAIYVKSNPGDFPKTGEITNILYEDLEMQGAIWFGIYIGPQQQYQPDGSGTGINCMIYPFADCPTNPQVPMKQITLRNVHGTGTILPPGVIRANVSQPSEDFLFENVQIEGQGLAIHGYYCENIFGMVKDSSPVPDCFKPKWRKF